MNVEIMNRNDVTDLSIEAKVQRGIKWADVAGRVGKSKEWTTAACPGPREPEPDGDRVRSKFLPYKPY